MVQRYRRSLRLRDYDYRQAGAYFVTICAQDRCCLFGDVTEGEMRLSDAGRMILDAWEALPAHYPAVDVDAFVVMPNHVHGIILLGSAPDTSGEAAPTALSLPEVMQRFKSLTTARYRAGVVEQDWPSFPRRLWQRGYYEHIIRHDRSLANIRRYIEANPSLWPSDEENPARS